MQNKVLDRDEWLKAQARFLEEEKAFTKQRDDLAKRRQQLPWTLVEKDYVFDAPHGKVTLGELFNGKRQLFVQHFMFGPTWDEGCPGCSFQADHINGGYDHIIQKDVSFVAISRAPIQKLEAFKKRMGWKFPWVSSAKNDFNFDFGVSFTDKDKAKGKVYYNYETIDYAGDEQPGNSTFYKDNDGKIFRAYSAYARGCEQLITTYMLFDMLPKGRDEENFKVHPMEWVKLHDQYGTSEKSCCH